MKVAVIGGNGQLGQDVVNAFSCVGDETISLCHSEIELTSLDSVVQCLNGLRPDVVVNTAAMHHVENCERDPQKAFAVNGTGVRNLSVIAEEIGASLIHVSTDYVFDGGKGSPYTEDDLPRPLNVYGNSKLAGEFFVRSTVSKHFVLRTSAIYGKHPCRAKGGLNFIQLMLKLAKERDELRVVDNEIVSPTPTVDIAKQIVTLSRSDSYGLHHATAEGSCSWYEFAREIFALTNTQVNLKIARAGEFPVKVPRPEFSVLENSRLKKAGLNMFRPWQVGLKEYLQ